MHVNNRKKKTFCFLLVPHPLIASMSTHFKQHWRHQPASFHWHVTDKCHVMKKTMPTEWNLVVSECIFAICPTSYQQQKTSSKQVYLFSVLNETISTALNVNDEFFFCQFPFKGLKSK